MEQAAHRRSGIILLLLKLAVFTLLVPCTVTLWLPRFFYASLYRWDARPQGAAAAAGIVLLVLGAAGYFSCALAFAFTGRGTPAPIDPPKRLVARGLYRYVRNPMYLSVLLVLLGECVMFRSWRLLRYAAFCFAFAFLFVLLYEEPALRSKFGASYEEYCRSVPRWIPRFRAKPRS